MIKITKNTMTGKLNMLAGEIQGVKLNRSIANIMLSDITQHFDDEIDSSGMKWPPLAQITIERRRKGRGSGSPKPLQDSGQLLMSLNIDQTNEHEAIVSANKYDAYFGINAAELQNNGGPGYILEEDGTITEIMVPAREYMYASREAVNEIEELAPTIAKKVTAG